MKLKIFSTTCETVSIRQRYCFQYNEVNLWTENIWCVTSSKNMDSSYMQNDFYWAENCFNCTDILIARRKIASTRQKLLFTKRRIVSLADLFSLPRKQFL